MLAIVNFMVILDSQIVILALPSIDAELRFAGGGAQWVMSAYLLGFGGFLLLGGRLGDVYGRRRIFLVGTAVFALASLACGLAARPSVLVVARAAHGVSAALMTPTALAILLATFPAGPERNRALATWGALGGIGATAALLVGGSLTELLGWESIFFLNLPVAAILLGLGPRLLAESRDRSAAGRMHGPAGAITLTASLVLVCYVVVEAPAAGWFSARTALLLAAVAVLAVGFGRLERRSPAPLVPPSLRGARGLVAGNALMLLAGMAAWGVGLLTSLYAQTVLGYAPLAFGLGTSALTVMAVVGSYGAQAALTPARAGRIAIAAIAALGGGALLLAQISVPGGYVADLLPGLLLFGLGLGAIGVTASVIALASVREEHVGIAGGLTTAAFQIGGALGAGIVTSVMVTRTIDPTNLASLTAGLRAGLATCVAFAALAMVIALRFSRHPRPRGDTHDR